MKKSVIQIDAEHDRKICIALFQKVERANRELAQWLLDHPRYSGATIARWLGCGETRILELRRWAQNGFKDNPSSARKRHRQNPLQGVDAPLISQNYFDLEDEEDDDEAGKNFSGNNLGQRREQDFYETPYSITRHLLDREPFKANLTVCEPACGDGAIVKILKSNWSPNKITSYDIETDFLLEDRKFDYVITNPPYSLTYEFIQKAKRVAKRKFAFLLPLNYLHGQKRFLNIYSDQTYGLKKVYVFTRYPMLGEPLRADGKYSTGMMVYAWYIFENGYGDLPVIDWIDNDGDVISIQSDHRHHQESIHTIA